MESSEDLGGKEIISELRECGYCFNFQIEDKPKGKIEDSDEYEFIKVYVNQTTNGGYTGDEFAGTCSIKITENEYLESKLLQLTKSSHRKY